MLSGLALALSELPLELIARHELERRICDRGGEREVQFLFADAECLLAVWRDGRLEVLLRAVPGVGRCRRGASMRLQGRRREELRISAIPPWMAAILRAAVLAFALLQLRNLRS